MRIIDCKLLKETKTYDCTFNDETFRVNVHNDKGKQIEVEVYKKKDLFFIPESRKKILKLIKRYFESES